MEDMEVTNKDNICIGMLVEIVAEEDKSTQKLTRGYILKIITKDGRAKKITVILTSGKKGIVKRIITKEELKRENFKFYNIFFFDKKIYSIWNKKENKYLVVDHLNKTSGNIEKLAFLFNDNTIAQKVLSQLNDKDYMLRCINRKKDIVENFKTLDIQFFSINQDRKLSYERLIEWESYFKNMR